VLLAIWVVGASLLLPVARAVAYLVAQPRLRRRRSRAIAISASFVAALAAVLFALPVPLWTMAQGITWAPPGATVVAGADGFVRTVAAAPGGPVRRGATLLVTEDPLLALRIEVLEAQLRLLAVRAHAELQVDRVKAELTREEMASVRAELALAKERAGALSIESPADGLFVLPAAQDLPGRFVRQGQQVGFVVRPERITVKVLVSQQDADLVAARTRGVEVRLAGRLYETLDAVVRRQVPAATNQLPNPALANVGGGIVPVEPRPNGGPTAVQGWFEVELELPATRTYAVGERAYVRFDHGWEPLAWRIYRAARQLFLRHFAV
jgi:putative peptide zinc metalloprotease protein